MKIPPMSKKSISILALVIAAVITLYFWAMIQMVTTPTVVIAGTTSGSSVAYADDDTALTGLSYYTHINDSLPHYQYKRMEDSVKKIQEQDELFKKGIGLGGFTLGPLGVYYGPPPARKDVSFDAFKAYAAAMNAIENATEERLRTTTNKDSVQKINAARQDSLAWYKKKYEREKQQADQIESDNQLHYFALNNYTLDMQTQFFLHHGANYLAVPHWDKISKTSDGGESRSGHYITKQIPVRYASEDKRILVPISKKWYRVLDTTLGIISWLFIFVMLYLFLGLPVQILINISKGKAFDNRNIKRFSIMATALLVLGVITMVSPAILWLCFSSIIPAEFKMPSVWQCLYDSLLFFALAVAVFIIRKAFQRGFKLQQEHDLTI